MPPTPSKIALAIALCFTSASLPALAQSAQPAQAAGGQPQAAELDEVVVSGRWLGPATEKSVRTYPGARDVVTEEELHQSGARNVEDALRQVPGVRVQDETGLGILPNIGVRGLNPKRSEQALILVDGIPVNLAPYGQSGLSLFPVSMETVQKIDVVRGGVATHYGPNNVGGVINIHTKPIPLKPTRTIKETVTVADNGNVLTDTYLRAGGYLNDQVGLQAQANIIRGDTFREHSKTRVDNLMLDADWLIDNDSSLKGKLQYYKADTEQPGALTPEAYAANREQSTRPRDRFDADTLRGNITYQKALNDQTELSWTTFGHNSHRSFTFSPADPGSTATNVLSSPRDFAVYGTEPQLTVTREGAIPQKILLGARLMREEVDFAVNNSAQAVNPFRDWRFENDAHALYASNTLSLLDGRLKVTPGIRYENIDLAYRDNRSGTSKTNKTQDVLPGLDIGYQLSDQVFAFANAHKSLRPVQFVQITNNTQPLLEAEKAKNYEAGIRVAHSKALSTGLTAFRIDFDNKIVSGGSNQPLVNLGQAKHQGVEASVTWSPATLPKLTLGGNYTYVDTEQLSGENRGKELPYAPNHLVAVQGNYKTGGWNLNLNGTYNSAAFSDPQNSTTEIQNGKNGPIPSYTVWNMQATRDFLWNNTTMQAAFGVNNLFDKDYYFRGVDFSEGRLPGQGRAFMASLKADF